MGDLHVVPRRQLRHDGRAAEVLGVAVIHLPVEVDLDQAIRLVLVVMHTPQALVSRPHGAESKRRHQRRRRVAGNRQQPDLRLRHRRHQFVEGAGQLEPALLRQVLGDEGAESSRTAHDADRFKLVQRAAQGNARHLVFALQFVERGNLRTIAPLAILDPAPHQLGDLEIEWHAAVLEHRRCIRHKGIIISTLNLCKRLFGKGNARERWEDAGLRLFACCLAAKHVCGSMQPSV